MVPVQRMILSSIGYSCFFKKFLCLIQELKHTQNQDQNYCLSRGSRLANPIPIRGGTAGMYMQPNLIFD